MADREHQIANERDDIHSLKEDLKRLEMELRANRRELLDANATNERMKDKLQDQVHKINLHRIENEALIK